MSQLAKLQHQFQTCVFDSNASDAPAWVSAEGRADPATQISVYSYAYRARLLEVLAKDFSAVHMAVGDDRFDELAQAYIHTHPSRFFSLREFGKHFSEFIQHPDQVWLAELARFEWTLCSAFDAADAPLLTEQAMAAIAPEQWPQLRFVPHPSLHILSFDWNTVPMWKILTSDEPTEIQAIANQPSHWLIWRDDLITRYRSLEDDEHAALSCLCSNGDFDEICGELVEFHAVEAVPLRAAGLLKAWIGQRLISGVIA